jgi:hypothetical protein
MNSEQHKKCLDLVDDIKECLKDRDTSIVLFALAITVSEELVLLCPTTPNREENYKEFCNAIPKWIKMIEEMYPENWMTKSKS